MSQELLCHHSVAWIRKSILQGFSVLGQSPTFLQSCRATWLENFLMDDELNVAEEEIFSILQNWAMLSPANSEAFLHLVELIRLPLIRPDFFNQVVIHWVNCSKTLEFNILFLCFANAANVKR